MGEGGAGLRAEALRWDPEAPIGKVISVSSKLRRDRARRLRGDQTDAETRLWDVLRAGRLDGWKWRRQAPVGPFITDFLCLEAALVVEADGGVHADQAEQDPRREAYLRSRGLRVLRFWNHVIEEDLERVCRTILAACRDSDPARRGRKVDRRV